MKLRLFVLLITAGLVFCLLVFAFLPAGAQEAVTVNSITPMPDRAGLTARFEIQFTTSNTGALAAGVDTIRISFPQSARMPSSIEAGHVIVNGTSCSEGGSVNVENHELIITPPTNIEAGTICTVIIIHPAGINNPPLSQETGDNAPDDLYELSVETSRDSAGSIEYEIFDWVGAYPMEVAQNDPVTVWGAGFMPGSTIHLNGLEGGPVEGSGIVGEDGTFEFIGRATGRVDLQLTATDGSGRSATMEGDEPALPPSQPPLAEFSYTPADPVKGEAIAFDASASTDPDGTIQSWEWDFGDGSEGREEMITHTYSGTGQYRVQLKVFDNRGSSGTASQTVTVAEIIEEEPNSPPVADAGEDQAIESDEVEGVEVKLDASGSSDPDGDPLTYNWIWESGSASGVNPAVILNPGTTIITLEVSDGELTATDELSVTIMRKPAPEPSPTPTIDKPVYPSAKFTYTPREPIAGEAIAFDGSGSVDPNDSFVSYEWRFGDGYTASGETASHKYEDPGIFTVSLFIRDAEGNVYSYTTNIEVKTEEGTNGAQPTTPPEDDDSDEGGISPIIWVIIVIGVVIVAGAVVFLLRRRSGTA